MRGLRPSLARFLARHDEQRACPIGDLRGNACGDHVVRGEGGFERAESFETGVAVDALVVAQYILVRLNRDDLADDASVSVALIARSWDSRENSSSLMRFRSRRWAISSSSAPSP